MDNILSEFNNRLALNDYNGAASYLKRLKLKDKTRQEALDHQIATLERYGGIAESILSKETNSDQKNMIAFAMNRRANNFGAIDKNTGRWENPYANKYIDYLTNLGNGENSYASYLDIEFDDIAAYNSFTDATGLVFNNKSDPNQVSPYMFNNNGKPTIRINKQTLLNGGFFDTFVGGLANNDQLLELNTDPIYGVNSYKSTANFNIKSYDSDDKLIDSWKGLDVNLRGAYELSKLAGDTYNNVISSAYSNVIPTELIGSGFMCGAQQQITEAAFRGEIERQQAKFMLDEIDAYYNNLLSHESLTQYDVFATDPNSDSANLFPVEDSALKNQYTKWMRSAAKEGRLKVAAGQSGGRVGTILTISAKVDKDNNLEDEAHGDIQLFVPGLLDEDARNLMDQDVNAKLLVEKSEHIAFGHHYNLTEGGRLINFQGDGGAYFQDDTGLSYKTPDEVDALMMKNEMINGGVADIKEKTSTNNLTDSQIKSYATDYATKIYDFINNIQPTQEEGEKEPSIKHSDEDLASIRNLVELIIAQVKKL